MKPFPMRDAYYVGEVAGLLRLSDCVVRKLCDLGDIKSFRIPAAGHRGHRRITRAALLRFVATNKDFDFALEELQRASA